MRSTRFRIAALCAAAAAAGVAACGDDEATKAGGSGPPVTLRIATTESSSRPAAKLIDEFARQASRLSGGRVRIEPVHEAVGFGGREPEQRLARQVVAGKLDGAVVPVRAWDTEGVSTLRALQAPFLLTSDALVERVVAELGPQMLRGLERAGVVGLALVPEGLRHPAGYREPLVGPDDYRDAVIRVLPSRDTYALFRALGATPRDLDGQRFTRAVESGAVDGVDTSFALAPGLQPPPAVITGNVTPYAKVDSLVLSEQADDALGEDERRLLRRAAEATAEALRARAVPDAEAAARYCRRGTVVLASDADVRALERAAAPITAELAEDPATRATLDRIRALKERQPVSADARVKACDGPGAPAPDTQGGARSTALDGIYRYEAPADYLIERGVEEGQARKDGGVHTATLRDGRFTDAWRNAEYVDSCSGTYGVRGRKVTFRWTEGCTGDWTMTFARDGKRIRWSDVRSLPPHDDPAAQRLNEAMNSVPWTKVG